MLRKIQNLVVAFGLLAMGFVFTSPVYAEGDCAGGITGKCNPICQSDADEQQKAAAGCTTDANDNVSKHIQKLINVAVGFIMVVGVLVIAFAGQRFVVSEGDPAKIVQAKNMLFWAVVGVVIALLAWTIITFILSMMPS